MIAAAEAIHDRGWAEGFARERLLTVSEWADRYRILSGVSSADPGNWRTARTPYLREIMDALGPQSPYRRVVFMKAAQVGGTECGNNWIGYVIHKAPAPMLIVWPTREVAIRNSQQRLAPMIEETPELRDLVREPRSKDSGNTVLMKTFRGGLLIITGANSAAGLRSMPVCDLFLDEVDEYPGDLDGQGDPITLAEKRTSNFPNAREFLVSSPTIRGLSRIEAEYQRSDQRRYFLSCPECRNFDWLRWENIRWDEGRPETARLACVACGARIEEKHKLTMLARGEWRPTAPPVSGTAGFHLSALYSPLGWKSWAQCAGEFLEAKQDPSKLKTWVNTVLGETWEERGDSVDPDSLRARVEDYGSEVPAGVGVLVAAVDVQVDRLEAVVKGYGAGEESWLIAFSQFHGDPEKAAPWLELDGFLRQGFAHASGQVLRVELAVVDSGGAHTEHVYRYVRSRMRGKGPSIFVIKGGTATGLPLVSRPSHHNRYRIPLFVLCVDTGKEVVLSRLLIPPPRAHVPSPGYVHLPAWVDDEYLAQLTAEKAVRRYVKGRGAVREWVKLRERNEALDLEVYALAALYIAGPNFVRALPERAARFSRAPANAGPAPAAPAATLATPPAGMVRRTPKPRGWVDAWRR